MKTPVKMYCPNSAPNIIGCLHHDRMKRIHNTHDWYITPADPYSVPTTGFSFFAATFPRAATHQPNHSRHKSLVNLCINGKLTAMKPCQQHTANWESPPTTISRFWDRKTINHITVSICLCGMRRWSWWCIHLRWTYICTSGNHWPKWSAAHEQSITLWLGTACIQSFGCFSFKSVSQFSDHFLCFGHPQEKIGWVLVHGASEQRHVELSGWSRYAQLQTMASQKMPVPF